MEETTWIQGINIIKDLLDNVGNYMDSRDQYYKEFIRQCRKLHGFKGSIL